MGLRAQRLLQLVDRPGRLPAPHHGGVDACRAARPRRRRDHVQRHSRAGDVAGAQRRSVGGAAFSDHRRLPGRLRPARPRGPLAVRPSQLRPARLGGACRIPADDVALARLARRWGRWHLRLRRGRVRHPLARRGHATGVGAVAAGHRGRHQQPGTTRRRLCDRGVRRQRRRGVGGWQPLCGADRQLPRPGPHLPGMPAQRPGRAGPERGVVHLPPYRRNLDRRVDHLHLGDLHRRGAERQRRTGDRGGGGRQRRRLARRRYRIGSPRPAEQLSPAPSPGSRPARCIGCIRRGTAARGRSRRSRSRSDRSPRWRCSRRPRAGWPPTTWDAGPSRRR